MTRAELQNPTQERFCDLNQFVFDSLFKNQHFQHQLCRPVIGSCRSKPHPTQHPYLLRRRYNDCQKQKSKTIHGKNNTQHKKQGSYKKKNNTHKRMSQWYHTMHPQPTWVFVPAYASPPPVLPPELLPHVNVNTMPAFTLSNTLPQNSG